MTVVAKSSAEPRESFDIKFAVDGSTKIASAQRERVIWSIFPLFFSPNVSSKTLLFDKEEIYDLADFPDSEIDKFIDSLTLEQYNAMNDWISRAPALSHIAKYTCDNCGHKNEILLRGLDNFF